MITGLAANFIAGGEYIKVIDSFCLGTFINIKESLCQEKPHRQLMEG